MSVLNVAKYILEKQGEMTAMKLQKLVYYAQCWSLVWDDKPLFDERIEAWANGPVCPSLYNAHRGKFSVAEGMIAGITSDFSEEQLETIDGVLGFYGDKSAQWLSDLTHIEAPWKDAREGVPIGERCNREITHAAMVEYYGGL